MDLIRELKDVRFEEALRGYDYTDVDAFLAKVRAEVAELMNQLEQSRARVAELEEQVAGGESESEGTLRRTLVLAQRLADETVADARASASDLVESATEDAERARATAEAESDRLLASANEESASILAAAEASRSGAEEEAERLRAEAEAEAARTRSIAQDEAQRLLAEAEHAGKERVAAIESEARDEVARMREPIREEIEQLEQTRSKQLVDIDALEAHLVEERDRVRKTVAALREGMSGSIDDLAKVAGDDALFTPAARPEISHASGSDVPAADDIELEGKVQRSAAPAPTVAQLADAAREGAAEKAAEADEKGSGPAHAVDADVAGQKTERIPVVEANAIAPEDASTTDGLVDLDGGPSSLFGTDVAADAEITSPADVTAQTTPAGDGNEESTDQAFLDRFSAAIDQLAIGD